MIPIIKHVEATDITSWLDTNSTLSVSVLALEPRINWYDFQNSTNSSKLNAQIDVNQECKFIINISSDQGWGDIEFINITAWYDDGNESTTYNNSGNLGGNLNLFLQYENTTGTGNNAVYRMLWPDDEATKGTLTEIVSTDPSGSPGNTDCYNITFPFTPGYQFRYAPDPTNSVPGYNDLKSWNFNITVADTSNNTDSEINEFGIYAYSEVVSTGMPSIIQGAPGDNATTAGSVSVTARSNGNYSLSVDVATLVHTVNPAWTIQNTTLWTRGADVSSWTNFDGNNPIYLYGNATNYLDAMDNNSSKTANDIDYRCEIPLVQQAGDYNATISYVLKTQI